MGDMRRVLCALIGLVTAAAPATAEAAGVTVRAAGPAVAGETVEVIVEANADGARLTFPDLQGELGLSACARSRGRGTRRFVLPYRPGWPGTHVLTVTVTSGACGGPVRTRWLPLVLEVAETGEAASAGAAAGPRPGCRRGDRVPIPRRMRRARLTLVCLLNAERRALGLPAVRWSPRLRRAASRKAHRLRRRARRGQHVLVATGEHAAPSRVLAAWLAADAHRGDLLDPALRRVGAAVVAGPRGPLRRLGATWVLEIG